ncbi:MAG: beta-ketoacyl-[acyl-carrier-protein] synthase family protein [Pseudomonadota bacterium]|nr:beta-ketoacyl-[acyl-carrier-protein] synthase family protein [Pseudomonadota bacterium]
MNEVWIVATAAVSALGENRSETWRRLLTGKSAIAPIKRFITDPYYCKIAAEIKDLQVDPQFTSRLPTLLEKLFQDFPAPLPNNCALIGATLKGDIDRREKIWQKKSTSENSAQNNFETATWVAQHFDLGDPGITINAACASSTIALATAASRIASGQKEAILVWAAEILAEFVFAGFASLQALTPYSCHPFAKKRNGLALGEGAAALLLMSDRQARKEGRKPLAKIRGWGVANDAVHLTAPARDGRGLIKACRRTLKRANLGAKKIAAINAHGTGTIHNDGMEIAAFSELFGRKKVPFHSIKGALGHTLGAAGALETVIAVESLKNQLLPPTAGLKDAENEIADQVSSERQKFSGEHLMVTNSGFGGVNAALILAGGD